MNWENCKGESATNGKRQIQLNSHQVYTTIFSHKWKRNLKIHREAQNTPDKEILSKTNNVRESYHISLEVVIETLNNKIT